MPYPSFAMISPAVPLAFIDGLGGMEMLLIFGIVLLLFGGDKLPEFARGLGKTMREFKKAAAGVEEEFKRAMDEDERKRAATPALPAGSTDAPPAEQPAYTYPEDGSTDTSAQAGPVSPDAATTGTTAPAGGADATAAAAAPEATSNPAGDAPPAPAAPPAPPRKPPIASEDYP